MEVCVMKMVVLGLEDVEDAGRAPLLLVTVPRIELELEIG